MLNINTIPIIGRCKTPDFLENNINIIKPFDKKSLEMSTKKN